MTRPTRTTMTTMLSQREAPPTRAGWLLWQLTTTPWSPQESARSALPSHTSPIMYSALWAWNWVGWSWRPTGSHEHLLWLDTLQPHGISSAFICIAFMCLILLIIAIIWLVWLQAAGTAAGEGERVSGHPATSAGRKRAGDQTTEAAIWAHRSVP